MRAWDLAVFVIIIEMSIGFVGILGEAAPKGGGLFHNPDDSYFLPNQGGEISKWQNLNATDAVGPTEGINPLSFIVDWIFFSFNMLFTMIGAFVAVSWVLYSEFHIAPQLCAFIQGIVYLIYTWAFIQWRSGRGGRAFE
jgi:hypothetical protein